MIVPTKLPGLRVAILVLVICAFLWAGLEGGLRQGILLGIGVSAVGVLYLVVRLLGGRTLTLPGWLAMCSAAGLATGAGSVFLTIFLMALKTGLHAHGPEFTPGEIAAVWGQLPLWAAVGLVGGLGVGLVTAAAGTLHANGRRHG